MKTLAILSVILALLAWPAKGAEPHDLMIVDLAVPASLTPNATSGIVYFTIMSHGNVEDQLIAVSTPIAKSATLHESYQEGDIAKMRELKSIDVIPGRLTKLEQGGQHVMLTGLNSPLKKGDKVLLNLVFAKAGEIEVEATVGDTVSGHVHTE
jgi:periplasmic copper chaperone A